MPKITFYIQKRRDGGTRKGIEVGERTVLGHFSKGGREDDPALLWYVDVRCSGKGLPTEPEAARDWLIKHKTIPDIVRKAATAVPAGIDPDVWPFQFERRVAGNVAISVTCSAIRRVDAQQLARLLREIADNWVDHLNSLAALSAVE